MRINKYLASATDLSRRKADEAIAAGRVTVNGQPAEPGSNVQPADSVTLDNRAITPTVKTITIMLNKPRGYVVSRDGQGSQTIYNLLSTQYRQLQPIGRLDKDSSGLLLLTNDGQLTQELTHPSYQKEKVYEVTLNKSLTAEHQRQIEAGVQLDDGPSQLAITPGATLNSYEIRMHEGRNRQIRRTFAALGYQVQTLHRTHFGPYKLGDLQSGVIQPIV